MPMYGGYGGPGDTFLKGYQIGLEGSLRTQQLRSEDAARRQQEAATAQHMALLLDQHNQQVQYQADMSKATAAALAESSTATPRDTINDPGGESSDPKQGLQISTNPNSVEFLNAFAKHALPVVAHYQPDKIREFQTSITTDALNLAKSQKELREPANKVPAAIQEVDALVNADEQLDNQNGKKWTVQEREQRRNDYMRDKILPVGSSFNVTMPDGTVVQQSTGRQPAKAAPGAVTPAMANKAEDIVTGATNAAQAAYDVIQYAENPGNVGLIGGVNRLASTLGGQFVDVKPGTEFKFAQATDLLKAAAIKSLRSDSNISEIERRQIIADLPTTSINESPSSAREKAKNIAMVIGQSARRQALRAGRPLPPELMTKDEIKAHFDAKEITYEQARNLMLHSPLSPAFADPQFTK